MTETWEEAFREKQMMWGKDPANSAVFAKAYFLEHGVKDVLVPGMGYGRNAKAFIDEGMAVTGIEISETAIGLARSELGLDVVIHRGSVTDMPFDDRTYDAVFCHGLIYLLDAAQRNKMLRDCFNQLRPGGHMIFSVITKEAPMYGRGSRLGDDWYEIMPGIKMYFYDEEAVRREFVAFGLIEIARIDEPAHGGVSLPFKVAICKKA
ncbi:MAG: class I SAM-dependent methyltransferase [Polyangiaceae bacterium]|nr:class I SAM-dependent methyltransferase [Polyangiaceae bacterium]